ncbi:hypothetical protein NDU88_001363 [Pleurodeles waltl]|uniref:Uncharacterized protein n=1 Tax=Pleurodeles waltl TaxID=8319 RepID=A0AAV7V9G1_PLEWA|nr:hypothetical protein NDU88_001363 [Pleurodeles waltl]
MKGGRRGGGAAALPRRRGAGPIQQRRRLSGEIRRCPRPASARPRGGGAPRASAPALQRLGARCTPAPDPTLRASAPTDGHMPATAPSLLVCSAPALHAPTSVYLNTTAPPHPCI